MKTLITLLCSVVCTLVFAQKSDSTHTHYRLIRGGFVEHSTALKSDIKTKNGIARIQSGKKIVATGLYKDNERYGRWRFYDPKDSLEQIYNYTTKKVEYNVSTSKISFEIDSLKAGDRVNPPIKIGGNSYGLYFLIKQFNPPQEFSEYPGVHNVYLIFYLNEFGKLVKYDAEIGSGEIKKTLTIGLQKFKPEDFDFSPALLNGKAVPSRFIYSNKLTVN